MTSRGELLMSLFFLLAFLSYATNVSRPHSVWRGLAIYVIPCLCMTLSLFSKEQGATTLLSLVLYDFIHYHGSVLEFFPKLLWQPRRQASAVAFVRRALVLGGQTIFLSLLRYWWNGKTSPDFVFDQNPAGFSQNRFVRTFSVSWVYCLYLADAVFPRHLCPDWSGRSIPLVTDWNDPRILGVLVLWMVAGGCLLSLLGLDKLVFGKTRSKQVWFDRTRRVVLTAFFAFTFSPFLLSSNLIVVVGLMKADRVIYLPLFGYCLLQGLVVQELKKKRALVHLAVLVQLALFCSKVHERNVVWSDQLSLWMSAYQVNPVSHHTIYNTGYELSLRQRYQEAEQVLRPIANPRTEGPSNTFVYCMVLYNLDRCDQVHPLIEEAMTVIQEKRGSDSPRDSDQHLNRVLSNLLVAQAYCTPDLAAAAKSCIKPSKRILPTNTRLIRQLSC